MNALFVQAVHGLPIEPLPGSINIMKSQVQQGQNGVIDFVSVQSHALICLTSIDWTANKSFPHAANARYPPNVRFPYKPLTRGW